MKDKPREQIPLNASYRWQYYPHDKSGYLYLKDGQVESTTELIKGKVMLDKDKEGNILGVEILLSI